MTETSTETKMEKKVRNVFPDRFTVDPANLEKIGGLLDQLRASVPACEATRKDLLNWIVERFPGDLGVTDLKELSDRFYDEERFLKLALGEVRAAKARGERLSINDILQRNSPSSGSVGKISRKRKLKAQPAGGGMATGDSHVASDPS
jgi:hypothetical protein